MKTTQEYIRLGFAGFFFIALAILGSKGLELLPLPRSYSALILLAYYSLPFSILFFFLLRKFKKREENFLIALLRKGLFFYSSSVFGLLVCIGGVCVTEYLNGYLNWSGLIMLFTIFAVWMSVQPILVDRRRVEKM